MRGLRSRFGVWAARLAAGLALVLLSTTPAPVRASVAVPRAPDPASLSLSASVSPSPLVIGAPAVYTVTVRNTGNAAASGVTTILPFSPPNALAIGTLPAACTSSGQIVTCTEMTIPAGGSVTYQVPVTILPNLPDGTNIALRAKATATGVPAAATDLITAAITSVDVEIDKTGPATVGPGGTMTYTITVTNHGPSDAAAVTWHDPMNGNLVTIDSFPCGNTGLTVTCQIGTMAPGETRTFTIPVTVKPGVPEGTVITNCAVVYTGTSRDTNPDNNQSCLDTTVTGGTPPVSNIEIVKSGPATVHQNGIISYSVTVTNHGPDPATNVVVNDPVNIPFEAISSLPSDCALHDTTIVCQANTLAVGETRNLTFSVRVAASVPAGTNIMNCASVVSKNNEVVQDPEPSCVQTLVVPTPMAQVAIVKTGPAAVDAGGTITYTLTVTNRGPDAAVNVVVTDPADTSLVTVTSAPGCTVTAGTVTCQAGTLAAGDTRVFTITAMADSGLAPGTVIRNCATVSSDTVDPDMDDQQSCIDTIVNPVIPVANLEVVKTGPATAHPGGTIGYSVTVTNHGPDNATDVVISDPIDATLVTPETLPSDCVLAGSTVVCTAGSLAVGESKTFTFTVRVAAGAPPGTTIDNCASASSQSTIVNPVGEPACVETAVVLPPMANVSIVKTAPAAVAPAGTITYTLTVTNHGPDAATGVLVTDPTDASLVTVTSAPGCTVTAGVVTCQVGTLAAGDTRVFAITAVVSTGVQGLLINNCAQVYTSTLDPDIADNESCASTAVGTPPPVEPVIDVAKDGPATANAGGTIEYSVTVTNHGPGDATAVAITDPLDPALSVTALPDSCFANGGTIVCLIGTLAAGESRTLTFTVTVASDTVPGTLIDNCAIATSDLARARVAGTRSCTQTAVLGPATAQIGIVKTGPALVRPGGTITYTLTVTNAGPDTAAAVIVKDPTDPALVTVTSVPGGCTVTAGTVTCRLGDLAPGETRHLTIKVRVNPGVGADTAIRNCADAYSPTADADTDDSQSCVQTLVAVPTADVEVVKTGPATAFAGRAVGYTITVTNHGPIAADVTVRDPIDQSLVTVISLPPDCVLRAGTITCGAGTLQPGQARTFFVTVMVGKDVRPGTRIENCATASGTHIKLKPARLRSCTVAEVVLPPVPVTG